YILTVYYALCLHDALPIYEAASWVDEVLGVFGEQVLGQSFLDDFLDTEFLDRVMLNVGAVLSGDHDVGDGHWLVIYVTDGNLALDRKSTRLNSSHQIISYA